MNTIEDMIKRTTKDTKNKIAIKIKIGDNWVSTRALNVKDAVRDL